MADNYLITGYHGEPHVTAENDRGIHAGIFGSGRYVLPVGQRFNAEYIGNNTIRMYNGKLMNNGAAAGIPAGEYVDLLISNAGQGMSRHDLIVFQYSKDSSTLIESGSFVIVSGEEVEVGAADPVLTQNDLLTNVATFDQMPLWRVVVSGTTISAPVQLFTVSNTVLGAVDHTHDNATATKAGFMSAADKKLLNSLDTAVVDLQTGSPIVDVVENKTLALSDVGTVQRVVTDSLDVVVTITIPTNDSVAIPVNTEIEIVQYGQSGVVIAAAEGVTLNSLDGMVGIAGQYGSVTLKKMDTNTWLLGGALA